MSRVQSPASRVQRLESSVQSPASRVQSPASRVQRPESSVQLLRPESRNSGMPFPVDIAKFLRITFLCNISGVCLFYLGFNSRIDRSSHQEVFVRKGVLKICSKFTIEHPCQSVILIKLLCKATKLTAKNMPISGIFLVGKRQKSDFLYIAEIFGKSLKIFVRILGDKLFFS